MHGVGRMKIRASDWSLIVFLAFLWGAGFFFVKVALAELQPFTVVIGRVGPAAVILLVVLLLRSEQLPRDWKSWRTFLILGALNNLIPFSLIFHGQQYVDAGVAAILNSTTPLFAAMAALAFGHDDRLDLVRILGIIIGALGVAVMVGVDVSTLNNRPSAAYFLCLGGAISFALGGISARTLTAGMRPIVAASGQLTAATIIGVPIGALLGSFEFGHLSTSTVIAVLMLAVLSTSVAYLIYFDVLARIGATRLLLVTLLIPPSTFLLAWFFLNELLSTQHLAGFILISIGLWTTTRIGAPRPTSELP